MVLRSLFFIFLYLPFMIVFVPIQFLISRSHGSTTRFRAGFTRWARGFWA